MPPDDTRCYARRLLNPFRGVAEIVETDHARAISTDGINWRVQIRSEIYKTPWSELAIPEQHDRYFVYGVWSRQDGLARIPVHPSLYQEHVEQSAQDLLFLLTDASRQIPFALQDNIELWLMDATDKQPIALIASLLPNEDIPEQKQLNWYATENADTAFTSQAFAAEQAKSTIKVQAQDLLHRVVKQRCIRPYHALWIERLHDGRGRILCNHTGKTQRRDEMLDRANFPPWLLCMDWQDEQTRQLVHDYLNWQAPLLLMLPLSHQARAELEQHAQLRPLAVHTYHHLYPEMINKTLMKKTLVEAVMRKAVTGRS